MKQFIKTVGKIGIPVALQCMLQASFSIVDQLMIGQLGKNSIAAVGLGGNFMLIFSVVMGAIGTVAGIFMLSCMFFASNILGLYTKDVVTIDEGTPYIQLLAYTC